MARVPSIFGSRHRTFGAGVAGRLPGSTRPGSSASWRKSSGVQMRKDMSEIVRNYEDLIRALKGVTPTAIYDALLPAFRKSQIYVPKATGALAASGQLTVGVDEGGRPMGLITYGDDSDVKYAAIVHEFTHLHHQSPARAKYLQSAIEEEMDSFLGSLLIDYAAVLA